MSSIKFDTVYIFGAGASYNTHPIIMNFYDSIDQAMSTADKMPFEKYVDLLNAMKKFKTPDDYAFKIFKSNDKKVYFEIKELHDVWINYFTSSDFYPGVSMYAKENNLVHMNKTEQDRIYGEIVVDQRYIKFLTLLESNKAIEKSFFYSWNYDRSIELSLIELSLKQHTHIINHLNGKASSHVLKENKHEIQFFWEKNVQIPPAANNYVFIGYSFPDVNSKQDDAFLDLASEIGAKVIIQNPESQLRKIKTRNKLKIEEVFDVDLFYCPE